MIRSPPLTRSARWRRFWAIFAAVLSALASASIGGWFKR
jgi:hypothetical protein